MEPFTTLDSVAVPISVPNVDTDQIIPARFLWRERGDGWAHLLFHDLRFENDAGKPRPQFVLNQPGYQGARILVADRNFGCGSSREHAVWCLFDYGIRAVIAPSFGDIFRNNCFQNGMLPIMLAPEIVEALLTMLAQSPGAHIQVDLAQQKIVSPNAEEHAFDVDPFRKECLLSGADDVAFTLGMRSRIDDFEKSYAENVSWL